MIIRALLLAATAGLVASDFVESTPAITWVQEGYNFIAKIPCLGCPFLYQDTSNGEQAPWTERDDSSALLFNISLPYDSAFLSLNNQPIYFNPAYKLPVTYANQILSDISAADLTNLISTNQLEASHEASFGGGGFFGVSYRSSFRRLSGSPAILFQFDITELWTDLTEKEIKLSMNSPDQQMLEVVLLQRPILSALERPAFEIVKAELVARTHNPVHSTSSQQVMHFQDWDSFGKKGTPSHLLTAWGSSFLDFLDSGVWALFVFVLAIIGLFVVVCLFCIFGCDLWKDDYEKAQSGKVITERRRGRSGDVETGRPRQAFKSAEELGLLGRGRVVGVGKRD